MNFLKNSSTADDINIQSRRYIIYVGRLVVDYVEDYQLCLMIFTVDIFSGEPGESAQLRFALKNFGRISSDLGEFHPLFSRRIC
jgi:hypothetical protein